MAYPSRTQDALQHGGLGGALRKSRRSVRWVCVRWGVVGGDGSWSGVRRPLSSTPVPFRPMVSSLLPRSVATFVAAAAVAVPIAGCGGGSSAGGDAGADPAAFLPASSPAYVEAQVRPGGDLKTNAEAVARKVLATSDPSGKLVGLLDKALADQGGSYEKDIAPWLGTRAGLAVTGAGAAGGNGTPDLAAAIASKDDAAAEAFLAREQGTTQREYRGVTYRYKSADDLATAVVDHAVVAGTERGFKSAIDAQQGDALADAAAFKKARTTVGTDGLGFAYVDPSRAFDLALGAAGSAGGAGAAKGLQQAQMLKGLLAGSGLQSVAAKLDVAADAVRIDAAAIGLKTGTAGAQGDGPGAAAAVPAGSWLSVGIGDIGGAVTRQLAQLGASGATGGIDPAAILQQFSGSLGLDVQKDLLSWMGDGAIFVRGTSMTDLNGALVVQSKDPAKSTAAIGKIHKLLSTFGIKTGALTGVAGAEGLTVGAGSLPDAIEVAAKGDKFVIAYGHAALKDALAGGAPLGDTAPFKTAAALLGGAKPSLFLDTPQVVTLLASRAGSDPSFAKAKPTLDAFGPAAAGVTSEGDVTRVKIAVAVP
ncbi:MAG: hypothetical protein QOF26_3970 [Baekduia sp.]|nr:hypothetical protein [Baekduia sp.]